MALDSTVTVLPQHLQGVKIRVQFTNGTELTVRDESIDKVAEKLQGALAHEQGRIRLVKCGATYIRADLVLGLRLYDVPV